MLWSMCKGHYLWPTTTHFKKGSSKAGVGQTGWLPLSVQTVSHPGCRPLSLGLPWMWLEGDKPAELAGTPNPTASFLCKAGRLPGGSVGRTLHWKIRGGDKNRTCSKKCIIYSVPREEAAGAVFQNISPAGNFIPACRGVTQI